MLYEAMTPPAGPTEPPASSATVKANRFLGLVGLTVMEISLSLWAAPPMNTLTSGSSPTHGSEGDDRVPGAPAELKLPKPVLRLRVAELCDGPGEGGICDAPVTHGGSLRGGGVGCGGGGGAMGIILEFWLAEAGWTKGLWAA